MVRYQSDRGRINIIDSAFVEKKYFERTLGTIKYETKDSPVWNRTIFSLEMEWAVHNFAYLIGFRKDKAKDVSFEYPCKYQILYNIIGVIVWPFIK